MYSPVKLQRNKIHQMDPAYECVINALKCTLPGLVGVFCWLYLRKPFTIFIILLPVFSMIIVILYPTYKQKIANMAFFLIFLAVLQFAVAILRYHYFALIAVFFILSFPAIASIKYRHPAVFAFLCAAIYINYPGGWNLGANRLIEIGISAIITFFFVLVFEYFTSIIRMRLIILYLSELIFDVFNLFTFSSGKKENSGIINKYLFKRPLSFRADFEVEKIFDSDKEKFVHRILIEFVNKGKIIDQGEFYFQKNKNYRNSVYPIFILCRRMFRDVTFLLKFHEYEDKIRKLIPSTEELIANAGSALKDAIIAMRAKHGAQNLLNVECVKKWLSQCDELKKSNMEIEKEILQFIYGMNCMVTDIEKFHEIINTKLMIPEK